MASLKGCRPQRLGHILRGPLRGRLRMRQKSPVLAMRLRIRVLPRTIRKPFVPLKEGRRSADRRTTGSAPPQKRKPASVCGAHHRFLPQRAELKRRRARLSAPHRGHAPRDLPRTWLRAALPGPPDPNGRTLSGTSEPHLAVRSRAGRSMPKAARIEVTSPIREPRPPHRSAVTGRRPFDERAGGVCNGNGDKCQRSVTPNATNSFGRWTPAIAAASDRAR